MMAMDANNIFNKTSHPKLNGMVVPLHVIKYNTIGGTLVITVHEQSLKAVHLYPFNQLDTTLCDKVCH
jgi:hypothetical protein